ncbi:MAG: hypothetical protein ACT4OP_03550 [Actinomycetota bacterium]
MARHTSPDIEAGRRLLNLLGVMGAAALLLIGISAIRGSGSEITTTVTSPLATSTSITPTTVISPTPSVTTSTTTPTTSTTLADPIDALVLTPSGIGDTALGTGLDQTLVTFNLLLGEPDEDTGWSEAFDTCPGTENRIVRWSSLQAFFTNGETEWGAEGARHFFHYGQSIAAGGGVYLELFMDKGIGLASTIGELQGAYGAQVTVSDDPLFGPFWEIVTTDAGVIWGTASGTGEQAIINAINGGLGCGE